MADYQVVWRIDLDANSARDAAAAALDIQRTVSTAMVFEICDEKGNFEVVDLDKPSRRAAKRHIRQPVLSGGTVRRKPRPIRLTEQDWREIYYAVELKRMHVAKDLEENGQHAGGVDLAAWHQQLKRILKTLGPDATSMHAALTTLLEAADQVLRRWQHTDLQHAVQDLNAAILPFGYGVAATRHRPLRRGD